MRIHDPPHEPLKLKGDVADIEYCQQPTVSVTFQEQVFFHSRDFCVANVRSIQKGEEVCHEKPFSAYAYCEMAVNSGDGGPVHAYIRRPQEAANANLICAQLVSPTQDQVDGAALQQYLLQAGSPYRPPRIRRLLELELDWHWEQREQ